MKVLFESNPMIDKSGEFRYSIDPPQYSGRLRLDVLGSLLPVDGFIPASDVIAWYDKASTEADIPPLDEFLDELVDLEVIGRDLSGIWVLEEPDTNDMAD